MLVKHGSWKRLSAALPAALLAFWLPAAAPVAEAHGLHVRAWTEGGTVHVQGTTGGRPAPGALVEVFGPGGGKLLEGETGASGVFSFPGPLRTDLRIVLSAGPGHRAETEIRSSGGPLGPVHEGRPTADDEGPESVRELVQALDHRLASMERQLALLAERKGPGVTEILGGIGYILGLLGAALYVKSRRKG